MSKVTANFLQAFVAVVLGNALYFLVLPHLPWRAYHVPFHLDVGLVVDFWFCLVAFGVIKTLDRLSKRRSS
jgi:hypothetical protein